MDDNVTTHDHNGLVRTPQEGIAIEVFAEANRGGRKHMEDVLGIQLDSTDRGQAFVGVFDGHGGKEAAMYANKTLWNNIKSREGFNTTNGTLVKEAIIEGFKVTHKNMWGERDQWKRSKAGTPSTSGTTVSVAIIRKDRMFVANVGDSTAVLGVSEEVKAADEEAPPNTERIKAIQLTSDHKPEHPDEKSRIENIGGKVLRSAKGIMRVAWKRERSDTTGTQEFDHVPFLSVARSLGDLWSYTEAHDDYFVSPLPDVSEYVIELERDRFLIIASDGLWNVVTPHEAVQFVDTFRRDELQELGSEKVKDSQVANALIQEALSRWHRRCWAADNISVMVVFFKEISATKQVATESKEIEQPLSVDSGNGSDADSPGPSSPPIDDEDLIEMDVRGGEIAEGYIPDDEDDMSTCTTIITNSDGVSSTKLRPKGKRKSGEMCSDCPTIPVKPKKRKSEDSLTVSTVAH